jgi:uncharacterized surface protein with fasciclin (FAS1) repeats
MTRKGMFAWLIAFVLAGALVATGCSPAEPDPAEQTDSVEVETRQEDVTPTVEATETPQGTVLDIVIGEEDLQTFDRAAREGRLYEAMEGLGPYTVIAPSDEAFDQMGADAINELLEPDNRDVLARLVTFHVIPGYWTIEDFRAVDRVPTLSGRFIEVSDAGGEGVLVGGAMVNEPVRETEDGVVYRVDQVLDPFTGQTSPGAAGTTDPQDD